jgi:RimJ/RimL family protein N-acetyltransferase
MIEFVTPTPEVIRAVFTHPDIWPALCDDGCDDPEAFEVMDSPMVRYLGPTLDGELMGVLMLVQQNAVTWELHTALLPSSRGKFTGQVFNALCAHLGRSIPAARYLRTWVPACNRPAMVAARRVGFKEVGKELGAFLRGGVLHDFHLFGVTLCPPQSP